ncbi:uncharacterized protein L203_102286 [Cryptococcus depauperatus CBS 7841]|uniref:Casein kinase II subunit beta n=1 Tax=Cryptococcus depauperatus CBS 7841 TaxID=1295531 RepID=A0A1E3IA72_9TREE|nr:casein kinase II subunit beta [Cryptococcus depauperatus CBS 7841]
MARQYPEVDPEEMAGEIYESDTVSSSQTSTLTWINWYTSLTGHDYFCEVHEEFIEDDFNLTGLQSMVPFWKEALDMVLDVEPEEDSSKIPDVSIVESSAELLYGLVHQRFILTKAGLSAMVDKYETGHFGACPRVFCNATPVIPAGRSDMPGIDTVKLYCPNCGDIYTPPSSKYQNVDGAFFGTTFAPLFFQSYPELASQPFIPPPPPNNPSNLPTPSSSPTPPIPVGGETHTNPNPHGGQRPALGRVYTPRIYGFKVSERAKSGPRMMWLRERPHFASELNQVNRKGQLKSNLISGVEGGDNDGELNNIRKGKLFDDEDDMDDDEEEEEEETESKVLPEGVMTGRQ